MTDPAWSSIRRSPTPTCSSWRRLPPRWAPSPCSTPSSCAGPVKLEALMRCGERSHGGRSMRCGHRDLGSRPRLCPRTPLSQLPIRLGTGGCSMDHAQENSDPWGRSGQPRSYRPSLALVVPDAACACVDAAVDRQHLARDPGRLVRRQVERGVGDVLRVTCAGQRRRRG